MPDGEAVEKPLIAGVLDAATMASDAITTRLGFGAVRCCVA